MSDAPGNGSKVAVLADRELLRTELLELCVSTIEGVRMAVDAGAVQLSLLVAAKEGRFFEELLAIVEAVAMFIDQYRLLEEPRTNPLAGFDFSGSLKGRSPEELRAELDFLQSLDTDSDVESRRLP